MGKNRKEQAVESTLLANYEKYYRLALSYSRNEADACDIVQEAAYKAILKCESLKNIEYADTWIYRIVINEAYTFLKKRRTEENLDEIEEKNISAEDEYENLDLKQALERLDEKDRTIVVLRFFEDRRLDEIAEILDMNLNTVKSRLYRVMDRLKLALD